MQPIQTAIPFTLLPVHVAQRYQHKVLLHAEESAVTAASVAMTAGQMAMIALARISNGSDTSS
jgi:hypothetical protein